MQEVTYENVEGFENIKIICRFNGTKADDDQLVKDYADIVAKRILQKERCK